MNKTLIASLRTAVPSGSLVLTHLRHTTPGHRHVFDVFGPDGFRLDARQVADATGLGYDRLRDAVVVRPGDIRPAMEPEVSLAAHLLHALAAGDEGYVITHQQARFVCPGRDGGLAFA